MSDAYSSDAAFTRRVEEITALSRGDLVALGEAHEAEEQRHVREAGYCCVAGAVAHPESCPWHE